eukprot:989151_1
MAQIRYVFMLLGASIAVNIVLVLNIALNQIIPRSNSINYSQSSTIPVNNIAPTVEGKHQLNKVISYCVYGTDPCFVLGALENALIAQKLYNDWTLYYYVDEKIASTAIVKQLQRLQNVKLFVMNDSLYARNTLWRYIAAFSRDIDIVLFRDTDSRLNIRERLAVKQWLASEQ